MEKTETHILTEIAAGNKLAFEQLFFQYQPQLVAFLAGLTHDPELSRDMAQEIFLSIWNERKKLEQIKSISAYLYQMARYKVYDYFDTFTSVDDVKRDKNYPDIYLYTNGSGAESMEEWLFTRELQALIQETVNRMSPQRQLVYRMSREKGLSNEEIALRLNISKRTVENHLTAALGILRKVIYVWILLTIS